MRRSHSPKPFQGIALKLAGVFDIHATQTPRPQCMHSRVLSVSKETALRSDWRQVAIDVRRSTTRAALRVK